MSNCRYQTLKKAKLLDSFEVCDLLEIMRQ